MSKEWAESVGITAVLYVSNNSHIYKSFRELLEKASQLDVELQEDAKKTVRYLLSHAKPTAGNMAGSSDIAEMKRLALNVQGLNS